MFLEHMRRESLKNSTQARYSIWYNEHRKRKHCFPIRLEGKLAPKPNYASSNPCDKVFFTLAKGFRNPSRPRITQTYWKSHLTSESFPLTAQEPVMPHSLTSPLLNPWVSSDPVLLMYRCADSPVNAWLTENLAAPILHMFLYLLFAWNKLVPTYTAGCYISTLEGFGAVICLAVSSQTRVLISMQLYMGPFPKENFTCYIVLLLHK